MCVGRISGESKTVGLSCPQIRNQPQRISTESALDQEGSHGHLPKSSGVSVLQQNDIYILLVYITVSPLGVQ